MRVRFHTNLDLLPCEEWPTELHAIPSVGDEVESVFRWKREHYDLHLTLKVVAVRWKCVDPEYRRWEPWVELHLNPVRHQTIRDFYEWYGRVTGKGVHAFI